MVKAINYNTTFLLKKQKLFLLPHRYCKERNAAEALAQYLADMAVAELLGFSLEVGLW